MSEKVDLDQLTFLDPKIQECPFPVYEYLHAYAPVFFDRRAGFWVITRYEDIRRIVADPVRFSSAATVELARDAVNVERAKAARKIYEEEGWLPTPTLSLMDPPRHTEIRAIFQSALRTSKIKELDSVIADAARRLVDEFIEARECDAVSAYCVPLPLIAICGQVGVPIDDIWKIKRWTDAWVRRFSMMQTEEEEALCIRAEIEFQHYFVDIVESLRQSPNDSILSELINTKLSDGTSLTYAEVTSHLLSDIFVGGSETSTNAMSEGILLLCQNPEQYQLLQSDVGNRLRNFIEETLRMRSPVHGLYRVTTEAVELGGVEIPAGAVLNLRFVAANRDEARFACPGKMDIERKNAASHLAFGSGIHACIGAPLARRELFWGFSELLNRCRNIRLKPGANDLSHAPGLNIRALNALHIEFDPA